MCAMNEQIEDPNKPLTKQEIYARLHAKSEPTVGKTQAERNLRGVAMCRRALGLVSHRD